MSTFYGDSSSSKKRRRHFRCVWGRGETLTVFGGAKATEHELASIESRLYVLFFLFFQEFTLKSPSWTPHTLHIYALYPPLPVSISSYSLNHSHAHSQTTMRAYVTFFLFSRIHTLIQTGSPTVTESSPSFTVDWTVAEMWSSMWLRVLSFTWRASRVRQQNVRIKI